MAESKAKKTESSKKIVDVKTDGDGAIGTSRPVIVTNRPIMKDPMMAEVSQLTGGAIDDSPASTPTDDSPPEPASGAPEITLSTKKLAIQVTDQPEPADDQDKTLMPKDTPVKKKVIKPLSDESSEKPAAKAAKKSPTIAELTLPDANEVPDVVPETDAAEAEPAPAAEPESAPGKDESVPSVGTAESTATTAGANAETPKEEMPIESAADDELVTRVQPGRSFDETAHEPLPDATTPAAPEQIELDAKGKPKTKQKKTGELSSEQQKAIEQGEYFLPITTAETRRLRREVVLATLFVFILIVVWLDIMLDAGLLSIGGVKAVTNFF
jgi:hypothetical protein